MAQFREDVKIRGGGLPYQNIQKPNIDLGAIWERANREEQIRRSQQSDQQLSQQQPTEQSLGSKALDFGNEMAKGIARTGIRLATANPIADTILRATGKEEMNLPWLGNVKTYSKDIRDTASDVMAGKKRARALVGSVAEPVIDVASLMTGGGVVGQAVKQGGKQLFKQAAMQGGKYGAGYGAIEGMKNDKDWGDIQKDAALGGVFGAAFGVGLHGTGRLLSEFGDKTIIPNISGKSERKARRALAALQMKKMRASLNKTRAEVPQYVSGVKGFVKNGNSRKNSVGSKNIIKVYHGTPLSNLSAEEIIPKNPAEKWSIPQESKNKIQPSISLTENKKFAYAFTDTAKNRNLGIKEYILSNERLLDLDDIKNKDVIAYHRINKAEIPNETNGWMTSKKAYRYLKENGYDGIRKTNINDLGGGGVEIRLFKTPKTFVKAQGTPIYRGQDGANFSMEGKSAGIGKSFTTDKKIAEVYRGSGKIVDGFVDNKDMLRYNELDVKTKKYIKSIIDERIGRVKVELENGNINPFEELVLELGEIARIKNKKAVDINSFGIPSESEIRILSEDAIKTKSQLTDIWNKEHEAPIDTTVIPERRMSFSGETTAPKINYQDVINARFGLLDKSPKTNAIDRQIVEAQKRVNDPTLFVNDIQAGANASGNSRFTALIRSGERSLQNEGDAGQALLARMQKTNLEGDLKTGQWKAQLNKIVQGMTPAQKANMTDVLEGKAPAIDDVVRAKSEEVRGLLDTIQREATGAGLDTGYRENYFPRIYNWNEMTRAGRKEEVLQHMVDTGQAGNKAEAEQFLKDFIFKNRERKAGNLEYERLYDLPGYEKDPEKAIGMYAEMAAKRISEVKNFGKKDQVANALIQKIAEGGGDYKEAQRVFDYMYKGEDHKAIADAILQYNTITKLSLSFLSNLTQNVNTVAKGGLLNTVKGATQAIAQGVRTIKNKKYDDIAYLANALDDVVERDQMGLLDPNRLTKGVMYLFQKIERFNRRTAANTGVIRAEQLLKVLQENPESAFAARQLKSLGIDIRDVMDGKLTQEQLLTAANKMAIATQFRVNSLSVPTLWRTPTGKVLTQYKTFSFIQTKFIRDEILKEVRHGNFAPLARFIVLAPIASFASQSVRNYINNTKATEEPMYRKWDMYRKAIGDLPSDVITQMQYANEKRGKWYTNWMDNVKNFSSPVSGPFIGDALQLSSALTKRDNIIRENTSPYSGKQNHPAAQEDPNLDLKRFAVSKIPFVGRNIQNSSFAYDRFGGYSTPAKQAEALMKEGIKTGNLSKIQEAVKLDPYLNDVARLKELQKEVIYEGLSQDEKNLREKLKEIKRENNKKPLFINQ